KSGYAWMHDSVQGIELVLIGKHDLAERFAVEGSIRLDHVLTPTLDDVRQGLGIGTNCFTREDVGVDHRRPTLGEHSCDLGFTAGDIACQSDEKHLSLD